MPFGSTIHAIWILLVAQLCLFADFVQSEAPHKITEMPSYPKARPCAENCLWYLNQGMGCGNNDAFCYCREDLRPDGSSWLSSCIRKDCATNSIDMSYGFAAWGELCSFSGDGPKPTTATTSQNP